MRCLWSGLGLQFFDFLAVLVVHADEEHELEEYRDQTQRQDVHAQVLNQVWLTASLELDASHLDPRQVII